MFNSLTGIITQKLPQTVFLKLGGIEWDIAVPDTTLDILPNVGEEAVVYTWLYHKDDSMRLFGFSSAGERSVFFDLMKVEGVGPKAAIKILSSVTATELAKTLDNEDLARLESISGIGKKTAQKMMLTLKGKLRLDSDDCVQSHTRSLGGGFAWADVSAALVNMGYEKRRCEETITALLETLKTDADFNTKNRPAQEEILFRRAIVELV
ncbi:MAG: Holliday junction branch migration protein RuvA [Spirochaetales bacterium]